MTDGEPDVVVAAMEDGYWPNPDPETWSRGFTVETGRACPICHTATVLVFGPDGITDFVCRAMENNAEQMAQFGFDHLNPPDESWSDGYEVPVYIYCDNPVCVHSEVMEWEDVGPELESWVVMSARMYDDLSKTDQRKAIERVQNHMRKND